MNYKSVLEEQIIKLQELQNKLIEKGGLENQIRIEQLSMSIRSIAFDLATVHNK